MIGNVSLQNLSAAQSNLQTSMQRLSSGLRVNSAKDDPAAIAIAASLTAQLGGTDQATQNVYEGLSLTDTANGALGQVSDTLQRMRELSVQAANGTNSASDRQAIQAEMAQLQQGLDSISNNTEFNGRKLLDGNFATSIQSGSNPGNTHQLALGDVSSTGLGLAGIDVSTSGGATSALASLDHAIGQVNSLKSQLGGAQAGLNSALANLSNTYENLAASNSRLIDADYAAEASNQAQAQVQSQASIKALALYNSVQGSALKLLGL